MGVPHCPHCGVELPAAASDESGATAAESSAASFCPSCGRRVEGWKPGFRATLGGAAVGGVLPGSEEPTRAIATSPSLLRASISASDVPPTTPTSEARPALESDSSMQRTIRKRPVGYLVAGAVVLVGAIAWLALRKPAVLPPPMMAPTADVPAPVVSTPGPAAGTPKKGKPRRISAPPIAAKAAAATATALPHKASAPAATPTAAPPPAASPAAAGTAAAQPGSPAPAAELPTAMNETLENEATPMTEAERRAEAAARVDADGVRFVVRAHLPQVHACYSRAFKESSPGGRVDIGMVIDGNGKATKIRTEANGTSSAGLARCLEQRLAEWDFPRPSGGEFELIYPFVFSPGT